MQFAQSSPPIVVRSDDGTTIEVTGEDGGVQVTIDRLSATLDRRAADDLVHALLEALAWKRS